MLLDEMRCAPVASFVVARLRFCLLLAAISFFGEKVSVPHVTLLPYPNMRILSTAIIQLTASLA